MAFTLLAIGWVAWMVLGYVVPWTAVLGQEVRPVLQSANGTWFIWVVASQSIAVLAAALQPEIAVGRSELALLAVFSRSLLGLRYLAHPTADRGRHLAALGPSHSVALRRHPVERGFPARYVRRRWPLPRPG
ncbi:hypothetical protein [Mycolicibacterium peregrinum]|uniref:hypothetical protein n=1 Tax=Mycolicibacterium peregrinum TaxID=43304 RepID=UPI002E80BDF3|nr:hypothetical protein [Mycolicibacterium peregrinum]